MFDIFIYFYICKDDTNLLHLSSICERLMQTVQFTSTSILFRLSVIEIEDIKRHLSKKNYFIFCKIATIKKGIYSITEYSKISSRVTVNLKKGKYLTVCFKISNRIVLRLLLPSLKCKQIALPQNIRLKTKEKRNAIFIDFFAFKSNAYSIQTPKLAIGNFSRDILQGFEFYNFETGSTLLAKRL